MNPKKKSTRQDRKPTLPTTKRETLATIAQAISIQRSAEKAEILRLRQQAKQAFDRAVLKHFKGELRKKPATVNTWGRFASDTLDLEISIRVNIKDLAELQVLKDRFNEAERLKVPITDSRDILKELRKSGLCEVNRKVAAILSVPGVAAELAKVGEEILKTPPGRSNVA